MLFPFRTDALCRATGKLTSSLNRGWPCDLLWPKEYGRRDTGPIPSLSLKRFYAFPLSPSLKTLPLT